MRLRCRLRELRGDRSLRVVAEAAGLNRGLLSEIERGYRLPLDKHLPALERAYGAPASAWYHGWSSLAVTEDD